MKRERERKRVVGGKEKEGVQTGPEYQSALFPVVEQSSFSCESGAVLWF